MDPDGISSAVDTLQKKKKAALACQSLSPDSSSGRLPGVAACDGPWDAKIATPFSSQLLE